MQHCGSEELFDTASLFEEPAGYYPTSPSETHVSRTLPCGKILHLTLIGHSPLWGHFLWNGAQAVSDYLYEHKELVVGKDVLELGAGAGLPGLVCGVLGAGKIVVTDYPDSDLISNLSRNVTANRTYLHHDSSVAVEPYLWGTGSRTLSSHLAAWRSSMDASPLPHTAIPAFDLLILADLLFNHSEHNALVCSILGTLKRPSASTDTITSPSRALVFFTPYRPWLLDKDMAFFDVARKHGLKVKKVVERVMDELLFEKDPGDELLRRTVFGYELSWADV